MKISVLQRMGSLILSEQGVRSSRTGPVICYMISSKYCRITDDEYRI